MGLADEVLKIETENRNLKTELEAVHKFAEILTAESKAKDERIKELETQLKAEVENKNVQNNARDKFVDMMATYITPLEGKAEILAESMAELLRTYHMATRRVV